jgi:Sec-independent protein translocase protein TatA
MFGALKGFKTAMKEDEGEGDKDDKDDKEEITENSEQAETEEETGDSPAKS